MGMIISAVGDTNGCMSWEEFMAIAEAYGFKVGYQKSIKDGRYENDTVTKDEVILFHEEKGIIIYAESYVDSIMSGGKGVNRAVVYGEVIADGELTEMQRAAFVGSHGSLKNHKGFVRFNFHATHYGLRSSLDALSANFEFSKHWRKDHFVWFLNYFEGDKGDDYDRIDKEKIAQCSPEVGKIIFGADYSPSKVDPLEMIKHPELKMSVEEIMQSDLYDVELHRLAHRVLDVIFEYAGDADDKAKPYLLDVRFKKNGLFHKRRSEGFILTTVYNGKPNSLFTPWGIWEFSGIRDLGRNQQDDAWIEIIQKDLSKRLGLTVVEVKKPITNIRLPNNPAFGVGEVDGVKLSAACDLGFDGREGEAEDVWKYLQAEFVRDREKEK